MSVTLADLNLSELESKIRKDPESYLQDFVNQYENYVSLETIYLSAPSEYVTKLSNLLMFLSQVIHLFPDYGHRFSENVTSALLLRSFGMNSHMRMAYLKAFMRLRARDFVSIQQSLDVAFRLHRCPDKHARRALRGFVIADMKRTNSKNKSGKTKALISSFLANATKDSDATVAREALIILVELYRRNVWKNEMCVNLIANACLAKSKKVYSKGVRFFLGHNERSVESDDSSDSDNNVSVANRIKQFKLAHRIGSKTRKRKKRLDRNVENLVRKYERKASNRAPEGVNIHAITLINDPQTFAEKLFHKLEKCNDRLEMRLLITELISHLIGIHKLLLNFYPSLQRFLRPQQREITRLLLFAAQASHDQVPPDMIVPMVRTIADNFVTDRASAEAITVGLNTIREICSRCPYAVDKDLLSDLIGYKSYRNKNVVAAARSLIRLYRQVNPLLLPKREIGRPTVAIREALGLDVDMTDTDALAASDMPTRVFGKCNVATSIAGAEVLIEMPKKQKRGRDACHHDRDYAGNNVEQPGKRPKLESASDEDEAEGASSDRDEDDGSEQELCGKESDSKQSKIEAGIASPSITSDEKPKLVENKAAEMLTAESVLATRILTDADFEAIRKRQAEKKLLFAATWSRSKKRGTEVVVNEEVLGDDNGDSDDGTNPEESQGLVSMRSITKLVKRAHSTKADRMDTIEEGRGGRKKYGFKVNRMNPHASTTNKEKRKNKAFQMVKHKARRKIKRSFREKQVALREHLKKFSRNLRH